MEIIIELLGIFKKEGLHYLGYIGSNGAHSLTGKFMLLILEKGLTEDDQVAKALYGTDKSDPKYRNLKKRVKKKLIDAIPLMDRGILGFTNEYNKAYYECLRACDQLVLLSRVAAYNTSENIIAHTYKVASKYQFFDVLLKLSYFKLKINALKGNIKIAQEEGAKCRNYLKEEKCIQLAKTVYLETMVNTTRKSSFSKLFLEEFKEKIQLLESLPAQSFEFRSWVLYIKTYYLILTDNKHELSVHIRKYEQVFKDWNTKNPSRIILLIVQKSHVYLSMKEYSKGLSFIQKHMPVITTKQNNWGLLKRYEFCHAINIDSRIANEVYSELVNSTYYNSQKNDLVSQLWLIHNAYLQFMLEYEQHPDATRFNIYKFMNEVDIYSRDKPGYNFSIFVIELMYYLLRDDRDSYMDRTTALMSYRIRHLKGKAFRRSSVFAQFLLDVEKYGFSYSKVRKSSVKKYDYLSSLDDRLSINEWEIISYDRMFEIAMDLLKRREEAFAV